MAKLKVSDFYYGAVLSMLLNSKINPALVEAGNDRQVYDFTTNGKDFVLFVKYRAENEDRKTGGYYSWTFNIVSDLNDIKQYVSSGKYFVMALVCGKNDLKESELVLLTEEDLKKIIEKDKTSISLSRKTGEKQYRISMGGGREKAHKVKFTRWNELF